MTPPDLNLLITLDVLLREGSVARAARRLGLSPSAMSRALARLRQATGDPLLVRAGRGLVATPRALELRERVGGLVEEAQAVLRPARALELTTLDRVFTLRCRDGFAENFAPPLLARIAAEAPGVRLCFQIKADKDSTPLRDGAVDLETGVVGRDSAPELRTQLLFRDRLVAAVRSGHPLCTAPISAERYARAGHVAVSRRGEERGPIDEALGRQGLERRVAVIVGSFTAALAIARDSDLVATVPERHAGVLAAGLHLSALPFPLPDLAISLMWHPRLDADPAHRWLRGVVRTICAA